MSAAGLHALLRQIADYGARGTTMPEVEGDRHFALAVKLLFVDVEETPWPALKGYERVRLTARGRDEIGLHAKLEDRA